MNYYVDVPVRIFGGKVASGGHSMVLLYELLCRCTSTGILHPAKTWGFRNNCCLLDVDPALFKRTYLKLHNPNKLMVQEIQIDIVNADETIATDLQAITYVTLHVR